MNDSKPLQQIKISIPETKTNYTITTNDSGYASIDFNVALQLWMPQQPKLYSITIASETDTI